MGQLESLLQVAVLAYMIGWSPLVKWLALHRSWLSLPQGLIAAALGWWLFGTPLGAALAGVSVMVSLLLIARQRRAVFAFGAGVGLFLSPPAAILSLMASLALGKLVDGKGLARPAAALLFPIAAYVLGKSDSVLLFGLLWTLCVVIAQTWSASVTVKRVLGVGLATIIICSLGGFYYLNRYVYHGFGMHVELIRRGASEFPVVALTFDDGPDPIYTPAILDILREKDVPAAFFVVGRQVERFPDLAQRIVSEGHTIANHTYQHRHLPGLSPSAQLAEVKRAEEAILRITEVQPKYFRPPRGMYTSHLMEILEEEGYTMVLWSLSSQDWAELSPTNIASNIIRRCQPGDILLFHDGGDLVRSSGGSRRNTVAALPSIIDALREQGYRFVTLREMLILKGLTEED